MLTAAAPMQEAAAMPAARVPEIFPGLVESFGPAGGVPGLVVICEHASNALPLGRRDLGDDLGLVPETRTSHAAWDIGALGLARGLAARLGADGQIGGGAVLVHAALSRLAYDLNRAPDHPGAMPVRSEVHDIPGNRGLTPAQRLARVRAIYRPFHATLADVIAGIMAQGVRPVLLAVHSFTPVFLGQRRTVEFGIIHDDDPALSLAVLAAAQGCGLDTRLNEPYSAAGDVTHTIRLHAVPCRLANTMLEVRNDLIADAPAQEAMAARLAPILAQAIATTVPGARACAS
jgi:predicted N-formylglutamate amidohydrolase